MFIKLVKARSYRYSDEMGEQHSFARDQVRDVPQHVYAALIKTPLFVDATAADMKVPDIPARKKPSKRKTEPKAPKSFLPAPHPREPETVQASLQVSPTSQSRPVRSTAVVTQPITNPQTGAHARQVTPLATREDPNQPAVDLSLYEGRTILFIRRGGIGDVLFVTPIIKFVKETVPDIKIEFATSEQLFPLVNKNPYIDRVLALPEAKARKKDKKYDGIFNFGGGIAANSEARELHCVEALARWVGIEDEIKDKNLVLKLTSGERVESHKAVSPLKVAGKRLVGIGTMASARIRTWPSVHTRDLVQRIVDGMDAQVLLLGKTKEPKSYDGFSKTRVASCINATTLSQSIGMISQLDIFVGTDSGLLWIAQALGIPAIGLFGPFNSEIRVDPQSQGMISIDAQCPCRPCFYHDSSNCDQMDSHGEVACMKAINPRVVFDALKEVMEFLDIRELQSEN